MSRTVITTATALTLCAVSSSLAVAQEAADSTDKSPPTPRLPDGTVDLGGDGVWDLPWTQDFEKLIVEEGGTAPMLPWTKAMRDYNRSNLSLYDPEGPLRGRHVILVDDIVDSGKTIRALLPVIRARGPASLEVCTLLHKRRNGIECSPRWVGFNAPAEFIVGYGLDYSDNFRHLAYIASV